MSTLAIALLVGLGQISQAQPLSLSAGAAAEAAPDCATELDTVNSPYPVWEQTAVLHRRGATEIGYQHAQIGLGPIQIGTGPYLDAFGTYNLDLKLRLLAGASTAVALVVAGYRVPTQAESRSIGNLNPVGLSNPYAPVWVFPTSLALSQIVGQRLHLHATTTVLLTYPGGGSGADVSWGQAGIAEVRAGKAWRALLHAGIEGFGVAPQGHIGLSFGYRGRHVAASVGYARRVSGDGESAHVFLFDGGLLLP